MLCIIFIILMGNLQDNQNNQNKKTRSNSDNYTDMNNTVNYSNKTSNNNNTNKYSTTKNSNSSKLPHKEKSQYRKDYFDTLQKNKFNNISTMIAMKNKLIQFNSNKKSSAKSTNISNNVSFINMQNGNTGKNTNTNNTKKMTSSSFKSENNSNNNNINDNKRNSANSNYQTPTNNNTKNIKYNTDNKSKKNSNLSKLSTINLDYEIDSNSNSNNNNKSTYNTTYNTTTNVSSVKEFQFNDDEGEGEEDLHLLNITHNMYNMNNELGLGGLGGFSGLYGKYIKSNEVDLNSNTNNTTKNQDLSDFIKKNISIKLRNEYIIKLIQKGIFYKDTNTANTTINITNTINNPKKSNSQFNCFFIIDWDDVLFCTSYLQNNEGIILNSNNLLTETESNKLIKIEFAVLRFLTCALKENSEVYILTTAREGWIEESSSQYMPSVCLLLKSCTLLYSRSLFESKYYGNAIKWKAKTFELIKSYYNTGSSTDNSNSTGNSVSNMIIVSDSMTSLELAMKISKDFKNIYVKTLKLKENPNLDDMIKQLNLIGDQFKQIFSALRNLNIKIRSNGVTPNNNNIDYSNLNNASVSGMLSSDKKNPYRMSRTNFVD